jgi:hypothetical protein
LTEKKDLANESMSMGHCVGGPDRGGGRRDGESSYWQEVRESHITILSLRDGSGIPRATIEVLPSGVLRQVQGPQNRALTPEASAHLRLALDAQEAWPDQGTVPRLGWPGHLYRGATARLSSLTRLRELRVLQQTQSGKISTKQVAYATYNALHDLASLAQYVAGIRFSIVDTGVRHGQMPEARRWMQATRTLPRVKLLGMVGGDASPRTLAVAWDVKGDLLFAVWAPNRADRASSLWTPQATWVSLTSDADVALAAYAGVRLLEPAVPPPVEVFPGVPPDFAAGLTPWKRTLLPVGMARRMRALQIAR